MPDHPQSTVTEPSNVFRESFLRWFESPDAHRAARDFGEVLYDLTGEGSRAIMLPREGRPSGTWFQHVARALVLDLESIRADLAGLAEQVGEGENLEDNRLALAIADLRPGVEELGATLRAALERATGPQAPPGADGAA
jgi:hypothetical protein